MPVRERTDLEVEGPEVAPRGALALANLNQSNGRWWSDDSRHDRLSASAVSMVVVCVAPLPPVGA